MSKYRYENDSIGQVELPIDALYGINTYRSIENFPLSGRSISTKLAFIKALATVKQAAALANVRVGALTDEQGAAIFGAAENVKNGGYDAHLIVDIYEGSGGTSTNMNINEVIANLAAIACGRCTGDYGFIHPNDHVNAGQSTNDVIPTGMKLAVYDTLADTVSGLRHLADTLQAKQRAFKDVLRLGRTCLQDAQPMTLGQAFGGYFSVVARHADELEVLQASLLTVPLGGTAIGTGFGSRPDYKIAVFDELSKLVGQTVRPSDDAFDGMQNMDVCARISAELRNTGNSLWKIANDLIVLSSGPAGGIAEIVLPSVQAGSSIMPGKVNPVIPMAVCQIAFAVTGNDTAIALACQQGLLEINHYELLVCDRLLDSAELLARMTRTFADRCISGIASNDDVALSNLMASSALATALVPTLGYSAVSGIVRAALKDKRSFTEVAIGRGLLTEDEIVPILRTVTSVSDPTI